MPFHSTETIEEARNVVLLHCKLGYDRCYRIKRDWDSDDIMGAMKSASRQFNLDPEK